MKKLILVSLMSVLFCGLANASADQLNITEFDTLENMESAELDEVAQQKINRLIPRIARRFCHSKVRPTYITISVSLVQVMWSLDRICGEQVIPPLETETVVEEKK